jgi:hypothetical protein
MFGREIAVLIGLDGVGRRIDEELPIERERTSE